MPPDPLVALTVFIVLALLATLLFLPQRGLISRLRRLRRYSERALLEDALKHIQRCESHGQQPSLHSLAGALEISTDQAAWLLDRLQTLALIEMGGVGFHLTPAGRQVALRVIRAHRLWEQYLAQETGFEEAEWHDQAEHYEHLLSAEEISTLARQLGHPTHDPHGDPIPDARGEFRPHAGQPLTAMPIDQPLRIVHIEDEPPEVYAQLVAEELAPGMTVRLMEVTPTKVRFWAYSGTPDSADEHLLAPIVAANISVIALPEERAKEAEARQVEKPEGGELATAPLSALKAGEKGRVVALSPRLRGAERRRMLDLGLLPGTEVRAELVSPSGDPTAYRVRETLIALRREQARLIQIEKVSEVN